MTETTESKAEPTAPSATLPPPNMGKFADTLALLTKAEVPFTVAYRPAEDPPERWIIVVGEAKKVFSDDPNHGLICGISRFVRLAEKDATRAEQAAKERRDMTAKLDELVPEHRTHGAEDEQRERKQREERQREEGRNPLAALFGALAEGRVEVSEVQLGR